MTDRHFICSIFSDMSVWWCTNKRIWPSSHSARYDSLDNSTWIRWTCLLTVKYGHTCFWFSNDTRRLYHMMTSSNENIFRVTGPLCGKFSGHQRIPLTQWPAKRSFGVFLDLCLNKRLSKSVGQWFETPSRSLWRHRKEFIMAWWHRSGSVLVQVMVCFLTALSPQANFTGSAQYITA